MKPSVVPGIKTTVTNTVDRERTIDFMGDAARVYATPMLVRDIEVACRNVLLEHLEPGSDSVGTRVEIDHMAATLLGMPATITATVAAVAGRLVTFDIEAHDSVETICRGRHQRFVVDVQTTHKRLLAKAAKAAAAEDAAEDAG